MTKRYQREQALMLSMIHGHGMHVARDHLGKQTQPTRQGPSSWLGQQRRTVSISWYDIGNITNVSPLAWPNFTTVIIDMIAYAIGVPV